MDLMGTKINFLGDSITEGHGASSPDKTFPMLIEREYGAICQNYGVGGSRIARQQDKNDKHSTDDFCARVAQMDNDADVVVVFGGTNDFGHGDAPFGTMTDRTPDTFYGALHTLYTQLIEKFPTVPIVVLTPLHRLNEDNLRGDGIKAQDVADLKAYVEAIREVAEYYSLPVLDLFKSSGIQPKLPIMQQMYMPDGLHPNDAGYKKLAHQISKFLETL